MTSLRTPLLLLAAVLTGCAAADRESPLAARTDSAPLAMATSAPAAAIPSAATGAAESRSAHAAPSADVLADNPRRYLELVAEQSAKLAQYTTTFIREERRGFPFPRLQPAERIACWYRRSPFSVRMKWLDPKIKFGESTYTEGRDGNKVRFIPRFGLFGLPPGVIRVGLNTPVIWGEARYPVSEFGVELLLRRTLATIDADRGTAKLTYRGLVTSPALDAAAHCIRIDYDPQQHAAPVQELYFDPRTHLPLRTEMRFADGRLDTAYTYSEFNPSVQLTQDDFVLEGERGAGGSSPAAATESP